MSSSSALPPLTLQVPPLLTYQTWFRIIAEEPDPEQQLIAIKKCLRTAMLAYGRSMRMTEDDLLLAMGYQSRSLNQIRKFIDGMCRAPDTRMRSLELEIVRVRIRKMYRLYLESISDEELESHCKDSDDPAVRQAFSYESQRRERVANAAFATIEIRDHRGETVREQLQALHYTQIQQMCLHRNPNYLLPLAMAPEIWYSCYSEGVGCKQRMIEMILAAEFLQDRAFTIAVDLTLWGKISKFELTPAAPPLSLLAEVTSNAPCHHGHTVHVGLRQELSNLHYASLQALCRSGGRTQRADFTRLGLSPEQWAGCYQVGTGCKARMIDSIMALASQPLQTQLSTHPAAVAAAAPAVAVAAAALALPPQERLQQELTSLHYATLQSLCRNGGRSPKADYSSIGLTQAQWLACYSSGTGCKARMIGSILQCVSNAANPAQPAAEAVDLALHTALSHIEVLHVTTLQALCKHGGYAPSLGEKFKSTLKLTPTEWLDCYREGPGCQQEMIAAIKAAAAAAQDRTLVNRGDNAVVRKAMKAIWTMQMQDLRSLCFGLIPPDVKEIQCLRGRDLRRCMAEGSGSRKLICLRLSLVLMEALGEAQVLTALVTIRSMDVDDLTNLCRNSGRLDHNGVAISFRELFPECSSAKWTAILRRVKHGISPHTLADSIAISLIEGYYYVSSSGEDDDGSGDDSGGDDVSSNDSSGDDEDDVDDDNQAPSIPAEFKEEFATLCKLSPKSLRFVCSKNGLDAGYDLHRLASKLTPVDWDICADVRPFTRENFLKCLLSLLRKSASAHVIKPNASPWAWSHWVSRELGKAIRLYSDDYFPHTELTAEFDRRKHETETPLFTIFSVNMALSKHLLWAVLNPETKGEDGASSPEVRTMHQERPFGKTSLPTIVVATELESVQRQIDVMRENGYDHIALSESYETKLQKRQWPEGGEVAVFLKRDSCLQLATTRPMPPKCSRWACADLCLATNPGTWFRLVGCHLPKRGGKMFDTSEWFEGIQPHEPMIAIGDMNGFELAQQPEMASFRTFDGSQFDLLIDVAYCRHVDASCVFYSPTVKLEAQSHSIMLLAVYRSTPIPIPAVAEVAHHQHDRNEVIAFVERLRMRIRTANHSILAAMCRNRGHSPALHSEKLVASEGIPAHLLPKSVEWESCLSHGTGSRDRTAQAIDALLRQVIARLGTSDCR